MSKWKCEICGSEFENYHAQGFDNTIYCPLCYFKKLYKDTELEREKLQNQLQQKENIIKEVREYIKMHTPSDIGICGNKTKRYYTLGEDSVDHILEILDKEVN